MQMRNYKTASERESPGRIYRPEESGNASRERGLARCRCGTTRQHLNEKVREGFTDPKSLEMLPEKEVLRDADAEL